MGIDASEEPDLLPPGKYNVQLSNVHISDVTMKCQWKITDGPHKGRYIFDYVPSSNELTTEIEEK